MECDEQSDRYDILETRWHTQEDYQYSYIHSHMLSSLLFEHPLGQPQTKIKLPTTEPE